MLFKIKKNKLDNFAIVDPIDAQIATQQALKFDSIQRQCSKFLRSKSDQEYYEGIFQRGSKTER